MPRITISYRRDDSGAITGRIFDRLATHYGRESIFRDIDNIPPGVDFRKHIDGILDESDVVLAIVGPRWIGPRGGLSRLTNAAEPVRVEIETALRKQRPLIPVLVLRGSMPRVEQLPESLQEFAYHNAVSVDTGQDFDVHMARLIRAMDRIIGGMTEAAAPVATVEGTFDIGAAPQPGADATRAPNETASYFNQSSSLKPYLSPFAQVEARGDTSQVLEAQVAAPTAAQHEEAPKTANLRGSAGLLRVEVKDLTAQLGTARKVALAQRGHDEKELARAQAKIEQLNERIAELTRELRAVRAAGPSAARRHPAVVALLTTVAVMAAAATMIVINITEWHRIVQWGERIVLEARAWWR